MAKDVIITPLDGDIQFENASGTEAGKIEQSGDDLVISNAVGDVLIGDGTADVYVGDGTNNVDIIFEQNGSIKGEDGSSVNLTIGSYDTDLTISGSTLNLQPAGNTTIIGGPLTVTKVSSDQNTSQDSGTIPATTIAETIKIHGGSYTNGQYTTEIVKVDRSGNLPLYVRQSKGTANSFTNLIRIGDHGQTNGTDIFAVFGKARVDGQFTVTGGSIVLGGTGRIQGIDTVSSGTDAANKNYADTKLPKSGGTMTGDLIVTGSITSTGIIYTDEIRDRTGQDLTITAGEASGYLSQTTHNDEIIRLAAEGGVIVYSSTDNLTSGLNKATTLINSSGHMSIAGDLTVVGGDITLNGTGRIQGIDTVSVGTDAANKTYADKKLDKTGGTMSGVITSDGITSGTTAANRAFQVSTAVSGALHVKAADGGTTGNAHTAPLITVTGNGSTVQGGIYVSQNSSTGTSLGFFTTDSYATGPKLGLSILDTGAVHINRGNLVLEGTGRIQGIDTVSSGTDAANKDYVDNHDPSTNKLPLAGGTMTGAIDFHQSDSEDIIITGNASASNTNQFFLKHNFAKVDIGNLRGDINFTSGSVQFTNNIYVGEYIYHKGDTNTFIRLLGDELRIVAGGRNIIKMDEGTDPDKVVLGDSATETYTEGDFLIGTTSNEGLLTVRTDSGTTQFTTMRNNSGGFVNRTYADYNNDGTTVEYQERIGVDGNYTRIGNFSNHPLYLMNNNDTKVSILTSGNVGIGTTDPQDTLHVSSTLRVGPYFSSNDRDHIRLVSHGTDTRINSPNERFHIENLTGNLILSASGGVGVGTTTPGADLQVVGSGSTVFDVQGSQGQLFSITDDLSGDLFTVSDISGVPVLNVNASATSSFDGYLNINGPRVHIENVGNDTTATLKLSGNNNTGTPGVQTSATIEHRGADLKTVLTHNGSDVITIGTGTDTVFAGKVGMASGYASGKFAVMSTDVHGSYDFYNNGTTYLNGATTVDAAFTQTGGAASSFSGNLTVDAGTSTTLWVKCDDGGNAIIRASGEGQGTGVLEVGQSTTYGGGISYNGDGSPAWASGESNDYITFYRLTNGNRSEVFSYPHDSDNVTFNGDITVSGGDITLGGTGRIQGIDTVSSGTDAANKTYVDNHTYSHNHDSRYYTETEIDSQNTTLNETLAHLRGWVPGYSNSTDATVRWNRTEDALELQSSSDTAIGAVYQARRVQNGETVRFTIMVKGSAAASNGLYLRLYQHDGDMPDGKTHVSNDAGGTYVQEDDRGDTGWYENNAITTSWVTFERAYTAPADGYVSLVVLNWTGIGSNSVYLKTPDIQTTRAANSNQLNGLGSSQFVRSDAADTMTGKLTASGGINGLTLANGGIAGSNFNITGVNQLEIADPGEGIVFKSGASGDITFAIVDDTNDNILRLTGTGASIDVNGGTRILDEKILMNAQASLIQSDGDSLKMMSGGSNGTYLDISDASNEVVISSDTDFVPASDNTGNVGTSARTFNNGRFTNFHVDSTLTVRSYIDLADSDGIRFGSGDDFRMFYDGSNNELEMEMESACNRIRITDNTTSRFQFAKDGTFTATGDVIAYSDERVKENIVTIGNALDKVSKLRGVTYNRTDIKDKSTKIGVIAQEIQKVLPEVVQKDEEGMLGVSYGNMVGLLIEGMKEQQQQIEELKAIVNKLQNEK